MTGIRFGNAQGPSWPLSRLLRRRSHRSTLPPEFRGSSQPATLRGLTTVSGEWTLVCLAWNLKRLAVLRLQKMK